MQRNQPALLVSWSIDKLTGPMQVMSITWHVCVLGDGGNDVSMIQAADVGIGLVGKVFSPIILTLTLINYKEENEEKD